MENCNRQHAEAVIGEVGKLPASEKNGLFVPRCAACAYEEGFIRGVETAAATMNKVAIDLRAAANQVREGENGVQRQNPA